MAFYLFLGSLIPRTDFSQLLHLADLAEHYQTHAEAAEVKGEEFSLHDFLCIHYFHPEKHEHEDESAHEQLPCHCFPTVSSLVLAMSDTRVSTPRILENSQEDAHTYLNRFHLSGNPAILEHPPAV